MRAATLCGLLARTLLHELAHPNDLADEEDLLVNPRLGIVGVVTELPECDFCYLPARYDAVITVGDRRGGASLCGGHRREKGPGTLGASGDVCLMLDSEVSDSVRGRATRFAPPG